MRVAVSVKIGLNGIKKSSGGTGGLAGGAGGEVGEGGKFFLVW